MKLYGTRIVTNGYKFRIQMWTWLWPFWCDIPDGRYPLEFVTRAEAQQWIELTMKRIERAKAPWRVVESEEPK